MEVRLILDSGGQRGRETPLARGVYLVGRSKLCQIRPKNRYVSRKHCAFIHRKHELLVQDLGSTSGTFVNGKRIQTATAISLNDGDRIQIGKSKFLIAIIGRPEPEVERPQKKREKKRERNPVAEEPVGLDKFNGHPVDLEKESDSPDSAISDSAISDSDVSDLDNSDSGSFGDSPVGEDSDSDKALAAEFGEEAENAVGGPHVVEDILSMLEEENEPDSDSPSSVIIGGNVTFLPGAAENVDVDPEDDSDGNVDFAAPKSSESLDGSQPVPSYALRQDWDVKSVYSWVSQKEAFAKEDERRAKRKLKEKINAKRAERGEAPLEDNSKHAAAQKATPAPTSSRSWAEWLEADNVRPILLTSVGLAFFLWLAWNFWKLWSFDG